VSSLTAIGSAAIAGSQTPTSKASLRADLARYEKERSACVNCASAETIDGKRNIQTLDTRINALKAQLTTVPRAAPSASVDESRSATAPVATGRIDVFA